LSTIDPQAASTRRGREAATAINFNLDDLLAFCAAADLSNFRRAAGAVQDAMKLPVTKGSNWPGPGGHQRLLRGHRT
jgi:hypothetical protein